MPKSKIEKFTGKQIKESVYEVYTFQDDKYISQFSSLARARAYVKRNKPVKYTIKKIVY